MLKCWFYSEWTDWFPPSHFLALIKIGSPDVRCQPVEKFSDSVPCFCAVADEHNTTVLPIHHTCITTSSLSLFSSVSGASHACQCAYWDPEGLRGVWALLQRWSWEALHWSPGNRSWQLWSCVLCEQTMAITPHGCVCTRVLYMTMIFHSGSWRPFQWSGGHQEDVF